MLLRATAAQCAIGVGVCEAALEMTTDYIQERKQFGQPIAMFQSVGHRAADAFIDVQAIRLTTLQACWRIAAGLPPVIDAHKRGVLLIEGGSNRDGLPNPKSEAGRMIAMTALSLRAPVALLLQVPSQPLYDNLYDNQK